MNHNTTESESDGNDNMHQQQQQQEQQLQRHEENDHETRTTMTPIININEGNNNTNDSNSNHINNSYYASIYNHNNDDQTSSPTATIGTGTGITTTTTILPTLPSTFNTNTDIQFVVWNDALHTTCIQNNTLFVTPSQVVQTMYPSHIQDIPTTIVHDDIDTYTYNKEDDADNYDKINTNRHYIQWNTFAKIDNSCTTSTMNSIDNSIELITLNQQQQTQKQQQKHQYEVVKKIIHQRLIQEYNANMAIPISETKKTIPDNNNNNTNESSSSSSSSNIVSNVLYQSIVPFKLMYSSMKYIANTAVSATTSSNSNTLLSSSDDYCPPSNYKTTTTAISTGTNHDSSSSTSSSSSNNTSILQTILSPHNILSQNIHSTHHNDYDITPLKQNKIKSPPPIPSTTTATTKWDQLYLSIDIMIDCILYIQQQLQIRQQQYLTKQQMIDENDNDNHDTTTSTIISTIVPVHMIRQEWFQQQSQQHEKHKQQQQKQNDRIAKLVSETLSDQQFHFLLSILVRPSNSSSGSSNTANNNNHNGSVNESIYLLQRINREIHLGGSVYILQLPISINNSTTSTIDNVNDDVRLTLYDIHQSMKIIQKNIIQWRNAIEKDLHPSIVSSRHINITNKQKVQQIHRQRMYEQHIDNAEATLLNLESVQMSILHSIHVSNPTISLLQQAKDVIKTLRPSSLTTTTIESLQQDFHNDDDDELQNDLDNLTLLDFETISHDASNNNDSESDTYCAIPNDSKSNSNNISKKEKTTTTTTTSTTSEDDISDAIVNLELRLENLTMEIDQTKYLQSSSSKTKPQQNKNMIISS